jgi:hypothetical protein
MFTVAAAAAADPQVQQVVLMERVPRYDGKEELSKFAKQMLHQAKQESSSVHKSKVSIGVHNLECEGGLRASRYRDERKGQVDNIHMRGTSGQVAYTRSVGSILAGAGLTTVQEAEQVARCQRITMRCARDSFQTQGRKGRKGPKQHHQPSTFQIATENRFGGLQGNY